MTAKTVIVITDPTLNTLYNTVWTLESLGVDINVPIDIIPMDGQHGHYVISVPASAPNKGVKQRCAAKDADGRRCIRGPRHRENHRYEEV